MKENLFKKCKVCGCTGEMALNRNKKESDTCPECMKKYKRMQRLYYEYIKKGTTDIVKINEFNELVVYLHAKTKLKPVPTTMAVVSTGTKIGDITKEVNPFKLYVPVPKDVLMDSSVYLFDYDDEKKCTDKRYATSLCCLLDTVLQYGNADVQDINVPYKQFLKPDIDEWISIIQLYYTNNDENIDSDKPIDGMFTCNRTYHWLCYIYATSHELKDDGTLSVPTEDYMRYTYDLMEDNVIRL